MVNPALAHPPHITALKNVTLGPVYSQPCLQFVANTARRGKKFATPGGQNNDDGQTHGSTQSAMVAAVPTTTFLT